MNGQQLTSTSRAETEALGMELGRQLRAGDLILLTGPLGAGKTAFVRGIGEALRIRGPITSPTFVIARTHPSLVDGPALIHVDAYRVGSLDEIDDLDLDASIDDSVTVIEWGRGKTEALAEQRLDIEIEVVDEDTRRLTVHAHGPRWADLAFG